MEEKRKPFFERLDESLDKTDEVVELQEAIGGAARLAGTALKQPFKQPIAYGVPAAVYTGAAKEPAIAQALDDPNWIDKVQNYTDWAGMINLGPIPVGDILDLTSAGVDMLQGHFTKDKERKARQFTDAGLRALAALPIAGYAINPITRTGARLLKKTQLPATAGVIAADVMTDGDPFGLVSAARDKKDSVKEPGTGDMSDIARGPTPKSAQDASGRFGDFFKDLMAQIKKENEYKINQMTTGSNIGGYTREIKPAGPPRMIAGRKTVSFESVSKDICNMLIEARASSGRRLLNQTSFANMTPGQLRNLVSDPAVMKQLRKMPPFQQVRAVTRGFLNPTVLGVLAAGALPLWLASKFGSPEESEARKGGAGAEGLPGTQGELDRMGVSPFGYLKGLVPAAAALASHQSRIQGMSLT